MIITDLYETNLSIYENANSNTEVYNVLIDTTDILICVKLVDFNKGNVTGKTVTLTVDKGYFTGYGNNKNNQNTINDTTTLTVTGTTNINGEFYATWTASEWGLATFKVNNTKIQCSVTGYKLVETLKTNIKIYSNGQDAHIHFGGSVSGIKTSGEATDIGLMATISEAWRPLANVTMGHHHRTYRGVGYAVGIGSDGKIIVRPKDSSIDYPSSLTCACGCTYALSRPKY